MNVWCSKVIKDSKIQHSSQQNQTPNFYSWQLLPENSLYICCGMVRLLYCSICPVLTFGFAKVTSQSIWCCLKHGFVLWTRFANKSMCSVHKDCEVFSWRTAELSFNSAAELLLPHKYSYQSTLSSSPPSPPLLKISQTWGCKHFSVTYKYKYKYKYKRHPVLYRSGIECGVVNLRPLPPARGSSCPVTFLNSQK